MDFLIVFILLAVVVVSAGWVGLIPLFGPGRETPADATSEQARRERLERRMREVPDE